MPEVEIISPHAAVIPLPDALGETQTGIASSPVQTIISRGLRESSIPLPDTLWETQTEQALRSATERYLKQRAQTLNLNLGESKIQEQVSQLTRLCSALSPENAIAFFKDPYVSENLEYFFSIEPYKIALALQVSSDIQKLARIHDFDPQFIPALNLGTFVILEMLRENDLNILSASSACRILELKNRYGPQSWGKNALIKHALEYLSRIDPQASRKDMEQQLTAQIALDIHGRLASRTEEMRYLQQSQGVEIEVLNYITHSRQAEERGIDKKWLPRGIPREKHSRKDWHLLPLLGVKEDVGERKYQVYEMTTNPTETVAAQTTIIFELMEGGFITEEMLSNESAENDRKGKEGYSLHVSTVFPRTIITTGSLKEYRDMARSLAGAFASNQRIAFGGFMSGGEEIANKSVAGNLTEVGKRNSQGHDEIAKDLVLIEVRNLDLTLRDQYSALLHKEVLDYAFRCAWQKYTHPYRTLSAAEEFAVRSWKAYRSELQQIYHRYGVSSDQLYKKHGNNWEETAWKEMVEAREKNPRFKQELATLIRKHTSAIRANKKEHRATTTKEMGKTSLEPVRYLTTEPLSKQSDRVYLPYEERVKLDVKPGDVIVLRVGKKTKAVYVMPAKIRGDGTIETQQESPLRISKNVLQDLQLPNGYAVIPLYNKPSKELHLNPVESRDSPIAKMRKPRRLLSEPEGKADNRFYLTYEDRQMLGVHPGQEVSVRFGKIIKSIRIAQAKERKDGTVETPLSRNWRLSKNIVREFGIPEGINLRARYDKDTREFVFGPSIAHLNKIEDLGKGKIKVQGGEMFFMQAFKQAAEYGIFTCIIDPNAQFKETVSTGFVDAYIVGSSETGLWKKIRIPIPDIAYDKDVTPRSEVGKQLDKLFLYHITSKEQQRLSKDKLRFARIFGKGKLATYHPDTIELSTAEKLEKFLNKHGKIMIKPRYGQQGKGIISVEKETDGYIIRSSVVDKNKEVHPFERKVRTVDEVLTTTQELRGERRYIAQQKIDLIRHSYQNEGKTYTRTPEIRVTLQRGIDGQARIAGMATRLLDPRFTGEEYLEDPKKTFNKTFPDQAEEMLTDIRSLVISALKLFEKAIGKLSGELTFDIGIEADGSPVIIEANSKAETRAIYVATGNKDAAYQSTARPLEYSLFLTDMN